MSDDLISRQAALDVIEWGKTYLSVFDKDGNISRPFEVANHELSKAIERIKEIPSVSQWIPCSERLPERNGVYPVTVVNFGNEWRLVDDAGYINGEWYTYSGEVYSDWHKGFRIIAWMPLPEPYREVDA